MKTKLAKIFALLMTAAAAATACPRVAGASPASPAQGLNALSDTDVRLELANDGMKTLLERAFVVDRVSEDQQAPEKAVVALQELSKSKLPPQERDARIKEVVAGISGVLPTMKDPQVLMNDAALLLRNGVDPDINTLEYFGENDSDLIKARVRPTVETCVAMYDRAAKLLDDRQRQIGNTLQANNAAAIQAWQDANNQLQLALFSGTMLTYDHVLVLDKSDKSRAKIAADGIVALKQWDTFDSGVQPAVRMQTAKLLMTRGKPADLARDLALAKQTFITLYAPAKPADAVQPAPDQFTQFNARYFAAVCDVLSGNAVDAEKSFKEVDDWRKANLAANKGDEYAMDMLRYRLELAQGHDDKAVAVLTNLVAKAPGLGGKIYPRILDKLPPSPDMSKLNPLMLMAIIQRAEPELSKPTPDNAVLERALAACAEFLAREKKKDPAATPTATQTTMLARALILKTERRPAEAASAFLDYADRYKADPAYKTTADGAFSEAIGQIVAASKDQTHHQADISGLEDRLYGLGVKSFNRSDMAYQYGRRLQRGHRPAEAVEAYKQVPADDPNAFLANYFEMVGLNQRLEADPKTDASNAVPPPRRAAVLADLQKLADTVSAQAAQREAASNGDDKKQHEYQALRVKTKLLAADVARREGNDPKRTLALLGDFEDAIKGLPEAETKGLLSQALNMRVQAYMATGDTSHATDALLQYLTTAGGNEGLTTVYNLLTRLNKELTEAQAANDQNKAIALAGDRAQLTPYLVKWASENTNPDIRKFTYKYRVFDADTQKLAAMLEPDPAARKEQLKKALAKYQELQSPDNFKLYQASLPANTPPEVRDYPDPIVTLGVGDVAFEMGDWKSVHDTIGQLLADNKLGDGTKEVKDEETKQPELIDNEQFWEAQYKFIKCTAEMSKDPSTGVNADTPKTMIARLMAQWQDRTGGKKLREKFVALAEELKVSPAATQPVAAK